MSLDNFPKRPKSDIISEMGMNIVSTIFNDKFGWIFRRTHEDHDYGIDAYIDFVTVEGQVTGRFIAAQIKTGKSYLSESGSCHWYTDTKEHLNYFLNLPIPILLIICDPDKKECYWACFEKGKVNFSANSWKYPISKNHILSIGCLEEIKKLFGPVSDFIEEFEEDKQTLKIIQESSYVSYCVPKEDIVNLNLKNLNSFLSRVIRNEQLTLAMQGKLCICTYGYEDDPREIFQIPEIRKWAKIARSKITDWYLCANGGKLPSTLVWVAVCTSNMKAELRMKPDGKLGYLLESDSKELSDFLAECFDGLNMATDKWGWSERLNYDISNLIKKELFPDISMPDYDEYINKKDL